MKKLLIATKNPGKFGEIASFLSDLPIKLVSLKDLNIEEEVNEDGKNYAENAQKKAQFYAGKSGIPTLADDSGIEIEALGGKPGKNTRRWLGFEMTDDQIIEHLKKVSKELGENRKAHFLSTVCLALPDGSVFFSKGEVSGIIAENPSIKKSAGYPFRSFFYLPEINKYFFEDELSLDEQKLYNHRWKAIDGLKSAIKKIFGI